MKGLFEIFKHPRVFLNQTITTEGWIRSHRFGKTIGFIGLNDGSTIKDLQIVCKATNLPLFNEISKLALHSAIQVEGKIIKTAADVQQEYELEANKINIVSASIADYPLQKKAHGWEFLRANAHLRIQTRFFQAIQMIRSCAIQAIHSFFASQQFYYLHAPIITENDCEGGGEAFFVNDQLTAKWFFGKPSRLTVSAQLHAEAFAQGLKQVYTFGPTFRAEKSNTRFHAAEFWMLEPEMAFGNLEKGITCAEALIKAVAKTVLSEELEALRYLEKRHGIPVVKRLETLITTKFARITYEKALEKLNALRVEKLQFGDELNRESERDLVEKIYHVPVVVYNYPLEHKAFYMKANTDQKTVRGFDILFPTIGEIVGGGERETIEEKIIARAKKLKIATTNLDWYLELRRYGYAPSVGFGLGFDRFLMYLSGVYNIRDIVPFYQGFKSLKF